MQIVIDKEKLVRMLKVSLYALTGADYVEIGETVDELLNEIGYKELPEHHGRLIDADAYREAWFNSRQFEPMLLLDFAPTVIEADKEVKE